MRAILAGEGLPRGRRIAVTLGSLLVAAAVWFPCLHFFYSPTVDRAALGDRQLRLWTDPDLRAAEVGKMRNKNAEWDFMGRTFLVLALANRALREPDAKATCLEAIDRILEETIRLERERGIFFFLLGYARTGDFLTNPPRSLFLDGEIALMLGARRMVEEREEYRAPMRERVDAMVEYMPLSPVGSGESYPNECWVFCNTAALAAIRIWDVLEGDDHSAFLHRWVATAKQKLLEPKTGLLFSSYGPGGKMYDGPEGSSIWMAAHCLQIVDEEFARDQYERAKKELARSFLGFGYAREWPESHVGPMDVDSGPVIPLLDASTSSSGLAMMAAAAFGDDAFFASLARSLNCAGFPSRRDGGLQYCASNQVGDAVLLYATELGPLWRKVREHGTRR